MMSSKRNPLKTAGGDRSSPPPSKSPGRALQPMPLAVWARVTAHKPDQLAGFRAWAELQKLGPRRAPEWQAAYEDFLARPINH